MHDIHDLSSVNEAPFVLTSAVASVMLTGPKILKEYIHNILHIHYYKQIQVPLQFICLVSSLIYKYLIVLNLRKT